MFMSHGLGGTELNPADTGRPQSDTISETSRVSKTYLGWLLSSIIMIKQIGPVSFFPNASISKHCSATTRQSLILRFHPHQRHDTILNILESLLVFLRRIRRGLGALDFLSVVPLNLKCR